MTITQATSATAPTTRDAVPSEVQATDEFRSVCPASATVMSLNLRGA